MKPADPASAHLQWLARELRFMYGEYKPELYWWEIVEMLRRFILVGIFVDVYPGNVIQIVTATSLTSTSSSCSSPFSLITILPTDSSPRRAPSPYYLLCQRCCAQVQHPR